MSVSRSRRCTLNGSRRTCSVGAALKRSTASVSCHTNRGRESGTDHAASGLRKMGHCRGRGVCTEPQFSLWHRQAHCTRGNNQMPCGRHLQQTAQHRRQLGKRSISSLAPALNPTLAHHRRNCGSATASRGAAWSGCGLANKVGERPTSRFGGGPESLMARSALRAKRALARDDLRWKIHQ